MQFKTIIAIDPSGNFTNGSGGTGMAWACYDNRSTPHIFDHTVWANTCETKDEYYNEIKFLLMLNVTSEDPKLVVIEDFRLQTGKAKAQSNQTMETSELIGKIEEWCKEANVTCVRQQNVVKSRWKDELLMKELKELGYQGELKPSGYTGKPSSRHAKDALRHLLHAVYFTQNKVGK